MAAPTFVSNTATSVTTATTPKTTANIAVVNGDVLVAHMFIENATSPNVCNVTTATGSTSAWTTAQQEVGLNDGTVAYAKSATATATATGNITVQFARSGGTAFFGGTVKVWRSASVGTSVKANNVRTSTAPTVGITTTAANSALDYGSCDWNATAGTVTYTSSAGTPTTDLTDQTTAGANYCVYCSHVTDSGVTGAKTIGMSAPSTQRWVLTVVEVKGSGGAAAKSMPPFGMRRQFIKRR